MNLHAQSPTWTNTFGTPHNDAGYSIAKTYDGGHIIGGTTTYDKLKSGQSYSGLVVIKVIYNKQYIGAIKVLILSNYGYEDPCYNCHLAGFKF